MRVIKGVWGVGVSEEDSVHKRIVYKGCSWREDMCRLATMSARAKAKILWTRKRKEKKGSNTIVNICPMQPTNLFYRLNDSNLGESAHKGLDPTQRLLRKQLSVKLQQNMENGVDGRKLFIFNNLISSIPILLLQFLLQSK